MNSSVLLWLEIGYWGGVVFVVVGVFLEGSEIWHRRKLGWFLRFLRPKKEIEAPSNEPNWVHNCADFGWLLLIIGLAAELVCGFKIDRIKTDEIAFLMAALESTQTDLSLAKIRLESAERETAHAQRESALARRETAFLNSNNLVLRSNLLVLEQNSPEKKPVFSAAAFIKFSTTATNFIKAEPLAASPLGKPVAGTLFLTRRSEPLDNIATISLTSETFSQFGNEITMELYWSPLFRYIVGTNRNETCEELIGELNRGHFSAMLFKDRLAVSNANLTLVLNGTVRKEFQLGRYNRVPDGFPGIGFSLIEASGVTANK